MLATCFNVEPQRRSPVLKVCYFFQVHMKQWSCSIQGITCNCGVIIRDHNDLVSFSCCGNPPKLHQDSSTPISVDIPRKKCLAPGITLTQLIKGLNSKYEVFPCCLIFFFIIIIFFFMYSDTDYNQRGCGSVFTFAFSRAVWKFRLVHRLHGQKWWTTQRRTLGRILGNMAAKHSEQMYGRNKTKQNRTNSGLPETSAVKVSAAVLVSIAFCQQILLVLLFIEVYFRSLAHITLYVIKAWTRFWCAIVEDIKGKLQVPRSLQEKRRMIMYYLTNFHLQYWFLSPANCLQTRFRVPQISSTRDIECHASVRLRWSENRVLYSWAKNSHFKPNSSMFGIKIFNEKQDF